MTLAAMEQPFSVPTEDIYDYPKMFEINMQSSVPISGHVYITNNNVTHNPFEQAGDFTLDGGLTTNLDKLFLDDSPNAITVICKFKNNVANGVLFHIGQEFVYGINDKYPFTFKIDGLYTHIYANSLSSQWYNIQDLGTQWNEIIVIYDNTSGTPSLQLYLNGVKQLATPSASTINFGSNKQLHVGKMYNKQFWSGYMKHIQIFPKVVYGLIKIKVKLKTLTSQEWTFDYIPVYTDSDGNTISDITTYIQESYFQLTVKPGQEISDSTFMMVYTKYDKPVTFASTLEKTGGSVQGSFDPSDPSNNEISNEGFKLLTNFDRQSTFDIDKTYAIITFHRELIEKDILSKSSGKTFKLLATDGTITRNLYHKHTETININSKKTRLVFKKLYLDHDNIRFKDRVILKYKNTSGQDTWVQFGTHLMLVSSSGSQYKNRIKYTTYDNEDDAYTLTNISDTQGLGWEYMPPWYPTVYTIDLSATERDVEMIFLASSSHPIAPSLGTPEYGFEIEIHEDVFSSVDPIISSISSNVQNLTNTINLSNFVTTNDDNIYDWSDYEIKFTTTIDGINTEQSFDIVPDTTTTPKTTFTLNMLLKQLEEDVTCKFEIWTTDTDNPNIAYTSSNFTLSKQNVTASNFELSLLSSATTPSILFQNNSQWIYMHEHSRLDQAFIHYKADVISQTNADYHLFFMNGANYLSESQYVDNSDKQKIKLRLTLNNKKISGDTLSLTDTTAFIIHKVSFNDFHTPTINPTSNINYFKEKQFRFTVSNPNYSFTFEGNTYEKPFKSDTYSMTNINNNIIINNSADDNFEALDIMPYNFIDGPNTLTFKIINTLSGVQNIYTTSIFEKSTNKSISIDLNVESDAIISCIPS